MEQIACTRSNERYAQKVFLLLGLFIAFFFYALLSNGTPIVRAGVGDNIEGHAWSSTIGWISFNSTNEVAPTADYGVTIDAGGNFDGYAWSDTIGWIDLSPAPDHTTYPGCGFPDDPGDPACFPASYDLATHEASGWARACAGTVSGDCSGVAPRSDGWDGWIKLRGAGYGVYLDGSTNEFEGYAWGDDVVGWISFNCDNDGSCGTADHAVVYVAPPTIVSFFASDNPVEYNTAAQLNWTTDAVDHCVGSWDPTGIELANGSYATSPLTAPASFTLECYGDPSEITSSGPQTVVVNIGPTECSNTFDDDGDLREDADDPGCWSDLQFDGVSVTGTYEQYDLVESDEPMCMNNKDDDNDGWTDHDDPGCWDGTGAYTPFDVDENNCGNAICENVKGETFGNCPRDCFFSWIFD